MTVCVGLASWIIQDGNYGNFQAGSTYRFALEFYPHEIVPSLAPGSAAFRNLVGAEHEVCAKVIHVASDAWVIDFGIPAFQEAEPPIWIENGSAIAGRIYIGIDPFFYFERLKNAAGMPNLFRDWLVRRILLETTPWKESVMPTGGKLVTREETAPTFVEVPSTNAWSDDGGNAHYILECELLGAG